MLGLVYKYREYNGRALEILINKELWLAEPKTLNDPFDCQIEYSEVISNTLDDLKLFPEARESFENAATAAVGNLRVLSLSTQNDNPLLWAHYSDSHKGFCLGFDDSQFDGFYNSDLRPKKVSYEAESPKLSLSKELIDTCDFQDKKWTSKLVGQLNRCLYEVACTKPKEWEYEQESRIITIHPMQGKVKSFKPFGLKCVYFGLNMPIAQQNTIMQLLASDEWEHVKFYRMKKVEGSFKLKPEKY